MTELLASLADFATFRHVTLDANDAAATQALEGASDIVRRETGRDWDRVDGDEVEVDGSGTDVLVLPPRIRPVEDVTKVVVTDQILGTQTELESTEYRLRDELLYRISVTSALVCGGGWPRGFGNITVECDHGVDPEDMPSDVRQALLEIASGIYASGQTGGREVEQRTLGGFTEIYATSAGGVVQVSDLSLSTLRSYRARSVA